MTLNFELFTGGAPAGTAGPLWARVVAGWVTLLPLLTTTAAFPLFNGVLAANLVHALPPKLATPTVAAALCALPPLLLTGAVTDTTFLFQLCGLSGFAIVFFVPAALQHASLRASVARWGEVGRAPRLLQRIVRASREPCVALSLGGPRHAPLDLLLGREAGPRRRRPRRRSLCPKRVDAAPPASPRQPRRRGARPLRPHHGTPTQNHPNPRDTLSPAPLFESRSRALES